MAQTDVVHELRCTWCGGGLAVEYPRSDDDDTIASIYCWDCNATWSSSGDPWTDDLGERVR